MIKNDLFLKALKGESVKRPPVWMMRQAGRYLPDFMRLREKYSFFERCQNPELATEITLMPIKQIGTDAAILFSDILVVPQAMGAPFEMKQGVGPWLEHPIQTEKDAYNMRVPSIKGTLSYVLKAIELTKRELNNSVPLIGFAGSPWTVFCYMVQGQGSRTFDRAKEFCYTNPALAHLLLQKITDTTIAYLRAKVEAGCDAIQVFDSWAGILSPLDYQVFSWQYAKQIIEGLKNKTHLIFFGKGGWFALEEMSKSNIALGVDWTITPKMARKLTQNKITLQGNLDPSRLLSPIPEIKNMVKQMIDEFGKDRYIANLGHGILPNIKVEHARAFVEAVKEY